MTRPERDFISLRPVSGAIYGHLFENMRVGVPRGVYWACSIEFAPLIAEGQEWPVSFAFEWIRWPVRRWQQLDGCSISASHEQEDVEASLYLFAEHQTTKEVQLSLQHKHADRFDVQVRMCLEVSGLSGDRARDVVIEARVEALLEGLIIVPDNLSPKPRDAQEALRALAPFADISTYQEPRFDRFRWVLAPKVAA